MGIPARVQEDTTTGATHLADPQVDDGTAWEVGYAYGRNIPVYGLRTDVRIGQQLDERVNLMILECLNELSSTIEQLLHTLRYAEKP